MFPKISIVTATYNSKKFLNQTLESVEKQTYKNIEHIFVDAYSTDGCVEIIKDYIKRNPDIKTKFIQSKPKGIANALNIGLEEATGDVMHFLHSDDYYVSGDSLEKAAERFQNNTKLEWLVGNPTFEVNKSYFQIPVTNIYKLLIKPMLHMRNLVSHENTFATRDFYNKYGPFDENSKVSVEYGIWLRALRDMKPELANEFFTVFIIHGDSTSSDPFNLFVRATREDLRIWRENKSLPVVGFYDQKPVYKLAKMSSKAINDLLDEFSPIDKLKK